jgi:quercetin dioxygenase-like cupin family protein
MNTLLDLSIAPADELAAAVESFVANAAIAYAACGIEESASLTPFTASRARAAVTPPPALVSIAAALEAMPNGAMRVALEACASRLPWTANGLPKSEGLENGYAFIEIVGPDGLGGPDTLRFGLYLQAPATDYPAHDHEAEEFYYVLSGHAEWQKNDGAYEVREPGTLVHHLPRERHAMRTGDAPLLAMWIWAGNIDMATYRIDGAIAV